MKKKDGFQGERYLVLPRLVSDMLAADPIAAALHITDIGYYPCADCHGVRRDKPIDQYVFIYCVAGRGWFAVDEARYDVAPNQYFILPAGVPTPTGLPPPSRGPSIGCISVARWHATTPTARPRHTTCPPQPHLAHKPALAHYSRRYSTPSKPPTP